MSWSGARIAAQMRRGRRYAYAILGALAAVLIPTPDPALMLVTLVLLVAAYELGIIGASWLDRFRPLDPISEQTDLDDPIAKAPLSADDGE